MLEGVWKKVRRTPVKSLILFMIFGLASALLAAGFNFTYKNLINIGKFYDVIAVLQSDAADQGSRQPELDKILNLPYVSFYEPSVLKASCGKITESLDQLQLDLTVGDDPSSGEELKQQEQMVIVFTYLGNSIIRIEDRLYGDIDCKGTEMKVSNLSSYAGPFVSGTKYIAYGKIKLDYVNPLTQSLDKANENCTFIIFDYARYLYNRSGKNVYENDITEDVIKNSPSPYCGVQGYEHRDSYWEDILKALELSRYTVNVMTVNDVKNLLDIHTGKAQLEDGYFFTEEDYKKGSQKCMMDYLLAKMNHLKVGDSIVLHFFNSPYNNLAGGFSDAVYLPSYPDFWGNDIGEKEFIIIGLFYPNESLTDLLENTNIPEEHMILIPDKTMADMVGDKTMEEYRVGRTPRYYKYLSVKVDAGHEKQFLKEVSKLKDIKVTVYDQGYSEAIKPFGFTTAIAGYIMGMAAVSMVFLVVIIIYTLSYRRRLDIQVMNLLGCGWLRKYLYLILTVLMISLPASVLGGFAGIKLSGSLMTGLMQDETGYRSSAAYAEYIGEDKELDIKLNYNSEGMIVLAAALPVNLSVMVFGSLGAALAIRRMRIKMIKGDIIS